MCGGSFSTAAGRRAEPIGKLGYRRAAGSLALGKREHARHAARRLEPVGLRKSNKQTSTKPVGARCQMPLSPYLKEGVFDPKAIEVMNTAFAAVCKSLQLSPRDDPFTQAVARKIIEIAATGEREPQRMHDLVLLALEAPDQRSA